MSDNVALGRKGEIFVMGKIMEGGWKFPTHTNFNMDGCDWAFEKNGRTITIQVKTSLKKNPRFTYKQKDFDYLIFTDLKDCYIIPKHLIGNTDKVTKTCKKTINKFDLLDHNGEKLLLELLDCRIKGSEIFNIGKLVKT